MAQDRRFPRWVFDHGDEPDPRFTLANERTFLAWIRTSLALLASGIALEALTLPILPALGTSASVVLLVLGTVVPAQAWLGWMRVERAVRLGRSLPAPTLAWPLGLGIVVAGVLLLLGLVLR